MSAPDVAGVLYKHRDQWFVPATGRWESSPSSHAATSLAEQLRGPR